MNPILLDSIVGVKDESGLWGIIDAKRDRHPVRRYLVTPPSLKMFLNAAADMLQSGITANGDLSG